MSRHQKNSNHDSDFASFRAVAPAHMTDDSLRALIRSHNSKSEAIYSAIQDMWQEDAPVVAKTEEWVSTSKSKKVETKTAPRRNDRDNRDRTAKGKAAAVAPKSNGSKTDAARVASPVDVEATNASSAAPASAAWGSAPLPSGKESKTSRKSHGANAEVNNANANTVWGSGAVSLAEKLKKIEADKSKPAPAPVETKQQPKKEAAPVPTAAAKAAAAEVVESVVVAASDDAQKVSATEKASAVETVSPEAITAAIVAAATTATESEEAGAAAATAGAAVTAGEKKARSRRSRGGKRGGRGSGGDETGDATADNVAEDLAAVSIVDDVKVEAPSTAVPVPAETSTSTPIAPVATTQAASPVRAAKNKNIEISSPAKDVVKLGKWEAAQAAVTIGGFQFGSFGGDDSNEPIAAPALSSPATWNDTSSAASPAVDTSAWPAGGAIGGITSSTLDTSSSTTTSVTPAPGLAAPVAARGPPGLEPANNQAGSSGGNNKSHGNNSRSAPGQMRFSKSEGHNQHFLSAGQQQQSQSTQLPPGIGANRSNNSNSNTNSNSNSNSSNSVSIGAGSSTTTLPYNQYSSPLDLNTSMLAPSTTTTGASGVPVTNPSTGAAATSAASTAASSAPSTIPQQQQMQQQYGAHHYPFYGNPYYNQQAAYFYGQQVPGYGYPGPQQGRGGYQQPQQRGPYDSNPYDPYQQQGGFPQDPSMLHGMHGGLAGPHQGNSNSGNNNNSASMGSKGNKGNNNSSSLGGSQQGGRGGDHSGHGNYGYNGHPYGSSQRPESLPGWQYQQGQQQVGGNNGWNGMMGGFPSASPAGPNQQQQGFPPQQLGMMPSQPQNGGSNSQGGNNRDTGFGNSNSFGGGRGSGNSSAGGAQGNW